MPGHLVVWIERVGVIRDSCASDVLRLPVWNSVSRTTGGFGCARHGSNARTHARAARNQGKLASSWRSLVNIVPDTADLAYFPVPIYSPGVATAGVVVGVLKVGAPICVWKCNAGAIPADPVVV